MEKDLVNLVNFIGKNLKKLRVINEFTIQNIADHSGLSTSFISQIEQGNRTVKPLDLRKIVDIYGFSLSIFISHLYEEKNKNVFDNSKIVHTFEDNILLFGKRNSNTNIFIQKPTFDLSNSQILQVSLDKKDKLFENYIIINTTITGILKQGTILLEFKDDEYLIKPGNEFHFKGNKLHRYRNMGNDIALITLFLKESKF